ncbi:phage integrase [Mycobacterium paraintracellulare]|nr:phage integrase [Mycobacterium paraintracellulare]
MAGRPPLRVGQHGKITRKNLGGGVWLVRTRFRDSDYVTRLVERRVKTGDSDKHGRGAEEELIKVLATRRPPVDAGGITADTKLAALVDMHVERLTEDGRSPATIDTYKATATKLAKVIGGTPVGIVKPGDVDTVLRSMTKRHGPGMARHARVLLRGGLQLAVMAGVLQSNPGRDLAPIKSKTKPKGAKALESDEARELLAKLRTSEFCQRHDLVDPIIMLLGTGLRRSEVLGLLWENWDEAASTISVTGKVLRVTGQGLFRFEDTKTDTSIRTLKLPRFVTDMLKVRREVPYVGEHDAIFASTRGTWRDPNNFGRDWRTVRGALGVSDAKFHSFRKTVATMIDDEGLSARVGADQLGHARPSMTQDRYMARGRVHTEVADMLDRLISDE